MRRLVPNSIIERIRRRLGRDQSGGSAIEAAIVLPIMVMFIAVVMDTGWAIFIDHNLNRAVRDGARYAIVRGSSSPEIATPTMIEDYVRSRALALDSTKLNVTVTYNPDNGPGSKITVQGSYPHDLLFTFFPMGPFNLSADATLTIFQ